MIEAYYIAVYWTARKEAAETCACRAEHFLRDLASADPIFQRWYRLGRSRSEALRHQVELTAESLLEILRQGRKYTDVGHRLIEDLGFGIGLWTGGVDLASADISLNCGVYSSFLGNACVLRFPSDASIQARVLQVKNLTEIMQYMVSAWEPDWGIVNSYTYLDTIKKQQGNKTPLVGWLTYVNTSPERVPELPAPVEVVPFGERRSLIILTRERFTVSDPAHMRLARQVAERLDQAELRG